jgi:O-antigen ligase
MSLAANAGDHPTNAPPNPSSAGRLLGLLTGTLYALFTLLPNSSSLVVSWPWVFIWQGMLLLAVLWCLWQIGQDKRLTPLGLGADWLVLLGAIAVICSVVGAEFAQQARWYGWVWLSFVAALYALRTWLKSRPQPLAAMQGLLTFQGYVGASFIGVSLLLWLTQTLIPFWQQAQQFQAAGVKLRFSFTALELQNWAPLGHQNYVAGYLILILPLLLILAWINQGKSRWFWGICLGLGLVDFYTTSSKGGVLGLITLLLLGLLGISLQQKLARRWWLGLGITAIALVAALISANDRLMGSLTGILQGQGAGQLAYRLINLDIGWRMGTAHPLTGIGLGNVPLQYQRYRPIWAGRESELTFQLHSTPAQLLAELGGWGLLLPLLLAIGLLWQCFRSLRTPQTLTAQRWNWGLTSALLAYGVVSLTDYQLDNVAISGIIVIYLACLLQLWQPTTSETPSNRYARPLFFGGLGFVLVIVIWLFPILRAWQLSQISFQALAAEKIPAFTEYLTQAEKLAPWEPYYPTQLGWNLGNLALISQDPAQRQDFLKTAIASFQRSIQVSPHQEFTHNNVGWLQLNGNPPQATQSFANGSKLVPAKRGLFYSLGISLLAQQKIDLALQAFTIECLRDPLFLTNPLWRDPNFARLYPPLVQAVQTRLEQFIQAHPNDVEFQQLLHQIKGGLYWWLGQFPQAQTALAKFGLPASQALLNFSQKPDPNQSSLAQLPTPANKVIQAWQQPEQRQALITQAWLEATQTPIPEMLMQQILASMEAAPDFYTWLRDYAPVLRYRRQRLGFGVSQRHIDGPNPEDFYMVLENLPMVTWFPDMFPSPILFPPLDQALQPLRETLWQAIL